MSKFGSDVSVDINSLDVEWERQSSIYLKCSEDYAEALYARDQAKFRLDVMRADLDSDIRKHPEEYSIDKITEAAIANTIVSDKNYQAEMNEYLSICNDVNVLLAAKSALEHKKKALEKLTDLYLSGYWSEPKVTTEAKNMYEKNVADRSVSTLKGSSRMSQRQKRYQEEQNGK